MRKFLFLPLSTYISSNVVIFNFISQFIPIIIQSSFFQVLRVANYESDAETSEVPWALARSSSKNSKPDLRRNVNPHYRVDELNEPPPRLPGIRSLLPLPGGDLLTGGTDLKIRRWDHYRFVANSLLFS